MNISGKAFMYSVGYCLRIMRIKFTLQDLTKRGVECCPTNSFPCLRRFYRIVSIFKLFLIKIFQKLYLLLVQNIILWK